MMEGISMSSISQILTSLHTFIFSTLAFIVTRLSKDYSSATFLLCTFLALIFLSKMMTSTERGGIQQPLLHIPLNFFSVVNTTAL